MTGPASVGSRPGLLAANMANALRAARERVAVRGAANVRKCALVRAANERRGGGIPKPVVEALLKHRLVHKI